MDKFGKNCYFYYITLTYLELEYDFLFLYLPLLPPEALCILIAHISQ